MSAWCADKMTAERAGPRRRDINRTRGPPSSAKGRSSNAARSTVNEAARLETLTKKFATPIVASEEFTTYCGGEWEALGSQSLRGVNAAMAVFRPAPMEREAAAPPTAARSRLLEFSDAEAIVLMYRDNPS